MQGTRAKGTDEWGKCDALIGELVASSGGAAISHRFGPYYRAVYQTAVCTLGTR